MGQKTPIFAFTSLTQTVSARVPENLPTLGVIEGDIRNGAISLKRTAQIPQFLSNPRENNIGAQLFGHVLQKLCGGGLPGVCGDIDGVSVAKLEVDLDFGVGLVLEFLEVLLPEFFEEVVTFNNEIGEPVTWRIRRLKEGFGKRMAGQAVAHQQVWRRPPAGREGPLRLQKTFCIQKRLKNDLGVLDLGKRGRASNDV